MKSQVDERIHLYRKRHAGIEVSPVRDGDDLGLVKNFDNFFQSCDAWAYQLESGLYVFAKDYS